MSSSIEQTPPKRRSFRLPIIFVRLITTLGIGAACYAPIYISTHRQKQADVYVEIALPKSNYKLTGAILEELDDMTLGHTGVPVAFSCGSDRIVGITKYNSTKGQLFLALTTRAAHGPFGGPLQVNLHISHVSELKPTGKLRLTSERFKEGKTTGVRLTKFVDAYGASVSVQGEIVLKAKEAVLFTLSR